MSGPMGWSPTPGYAGPAAFPGASSPKRPKGPLMLIAAGAVVVLVALGAIGVGAISGGGTSNELAAACESVDIDAWKADRAALLRISREPAPTELTAIAAWIATLVEAQDKVTAPLLPVLRAAFALEDADPEGAANLETFEAKMSEVTSLTAQYRASAIDARTYVQQVQTPLSDVQRASQEMLSSAQNTVVAEGACEKLQLEA